MEEINLLNDGLNKDGHLFLVYHKKWNRIVQVRVCTYAFLADCPEKGHRTGSITGGTYGLQYSVAGDHNQIIDKVVCCESCYQKFLLNHYINNTDVQKCVKCYLFNVDDIKYTAPESYPINKLPHNDYMLPFKQITFNSMSEACKSAFEDVSNGDWTKKTSRLTLNQKG